MIVRKAKLFMAWEFEDEEKWLAEMEANGLHFCKYRLFWYEFETGEPNRYQYKLEMLPNLSTHPESRRYIEFMEDMGVEMIDSYLRWVYFRKPADGEPFELYSDLEQRLSHLRGIRALIVLVLAVLLPNLINLRHLTRSFWIVPPLALYAVLGIAAARGLMRIHKNIQRLEKERVIHE